LTSNDKFIEEKIDEIDVIKSRLITYCESKETDGENVPEFAQFIEKNCDYPSLKIGIEGLIDNLTVQRTTSQNKL
jgi:hypothetical protein